MPHLAHAFLVFLFFTTVYAQRTTTDSVVVFALQGTVYDKGGGTPIQGAKVNVVGTDVSNFSTITDDNGGFSFVDKGGDRYIKENITYSILVEKEGYLVVKDQITTVGLNESTTFVKEYYLAAVRVCGPPPPIIHFDQHSSQLSQSADSVLTELLQVLVDNPTIVIEVRGHTDGEEVGELGMMRSRAVQEQLIAQGIPIGRIEVVARGPSEPVVTAEQLNRFTDEQELRTAQALNRRVEFKVLSFDWKPR